MLPALGSWLALLELGWVMRRLDTMAQEVVVASYKLPPIDHHHYYDPR